MFGWWVKDFTDTAGKVAQADATHQATLFAQANAAEAE
jgi:hypothetical protein